MRRFLPAASLLVLVTALPAAADEKGLTLEDQTGVAVTIYNQDLALVRDASCCSTATRKVAARSIGRFRIPCA